MTQQHQGKDARPTGLLKLASVLTVVLVALVAVGGWAAYQERFERETGRIAEVLELREGMTVADVGAGAGRYSVFLAERVGGSGQVFSTEVEQDKVDDIREAVEGRDNVTVILGAFDDTQLPEACCDRILLRNVYHHFVDVDAMDQSLLRSLKPGGVIAVIDFSPRGGMRAPDGVPENRGGHGVPTDLLIEEMERNGFELVAEYDDWPGGRSAFCVRFRRPLE